jgi:hypothetical protein
LVRVGLVMRVAQWDRIAGVGVDCACGRHNRRSRGPVRTSAVAVRRSVRRRLRRSRIDRCVGRRSEGGRQTRSPVRTERVMQHQEQCGSRRQHRKIKGQLSIAVCVRVFARRTSRTRGSTRDAAPNCSHGSRDAAAGICRSDRCRDPPPAMTAQTGGMSGHSLRAVPAQVMSHVVPQTGAALVPGGRRVDVPLGSLLCGARRIRNGSISGHVVGRGGTCFHSFNPNWIDPNRIDPNWKSRKPFDRGRSRVDGIPS